MVGRDAREGGERPERDARDLDTLDDQELYDDEDDPDAEGAYDEAEADVEDAYDDEEPDDDEGDIEDAYDEDDAYDADAEDDLATEGAYDEDEPDDDDTYEDADDEGDVATGPPAAYATDSADDWYDYDEQVDGDEDAWDGDGDGDDPAWPPQSPEPLTVAAARAREAQPSIWAPGTAPGAWVALGRPQFDNPLHQLLTEPAQVRTRRRNLSVFSLAGLTNVLLFAYGAVAALLAGLTAALARRRSALEVVDAEARDAALARAGQLVDATSLGVVATFVAMTVVSMVWCWVAAHNQRMLGSADAPPTPTIAALGWIVPGANVFLPFRTVSELSAGPFNEETSPRAVLRWWACWLASAATAAYTVSTARSPNSVREASWLTLVALLVTALFLLCFNQALSVFRRVARMQHDLAVGSD